MLWFAIVMLADSGWWSYWHWRRRWINLAKTFWRWVQTKFNS